jgi:type III restriction enzyme
MARLRQWCADATSASWGEGGPNYRFVYLDEKGFEAHSPGHFAGLIQMFRDYQT